MSRTILGLALSIALMGCASSGQHTRAEVGSQGPALSFEELEELRHVERAGKPAIVACYTDELERRGNKSLKGNVSVNMYITPDGSAREVLIADSTLNAPLVHECIRNVVAGWEFPRVQSATWYGTAFAFDPAY